MSIEPVPPSALRRWVGFVFGPIPRVLLFSAGLLAVWHHWRVTPERPLKEVTFPWPHHCLIDMRNGQYSAPGVERLVFNGVASAADGSEGVRSFQINLAEGRIDEVLTASRAKFAICAPNLSWYAYLTVDHTVEVVELPSLQPRFTIPALGRPPGISGYWWLTASPSSRWLVVQPMEGGDGQIWDATSGKRVLKFKSAGPTSWQRWSGDGRWLACQLDQDDNKRVEIWDLEKGKGVKTLVAPDERAFLDIQFLANDRCLVAENVFKPAGGDDGWTVIAAARELPDGARGSELVADFDTPPSAHASGFHTRHHNNALFDDEVVVSPDQRWLVFRTAKTGHLWDISATVPQRADEMLQGWRCDQFDVTTRRATTVRNDGKNWGVFNLTTRKWEMQHDDEAREVRLDWSADGRYLAASRMFENARGRQLREQGHPGWYLIPDMQYIDVETVLYDVETSQPIRSLPSMSVCAWPKNGTQVWTMNLIASAGAWPSFHFELWPIHKPGPPWWLWLLTAAGGGILAWDVRKVVAPKAI